MSIVPIYIARSYIVEYAKADSDISTAVSVDRHQHQQLRHTDHRPTANLGRNHQKEAAPASPFYQSSLRAVRQKLSASTGTDLESRKF